MKRQRSSPQTCLLVWFMLTALFACRPDKKKPEAAARAESGLQATVLRRLHLNDIPSASGMELAGNQLYLIGDDSPFLYVLDLATWQQIDQIRLFGTGNFQQGRISKLRKADLECLTLLNSEGGNQLVALGSGSTPARNKAYLIALPAGKGKTGRVAQRSLEELYEAIQAHNDLLGDDVLNLEGAAASADQVLLLQRAGPGGPNLLLSFPSQDFMAYLSGTRKELPAYQVFAFHLPRLAGLESHFSGAVVHEQRLFFSASVENTADAIRDGEVLGSFIGWIALAALKPGRQPLEVHAALVRDEKGEPYKGKVESLVILDGSRSQAVRALAVTDNDQGQSELLELKLSWPGLPAE